MHKDNRISNYSYSNTDITLFMESTGEAVVRPLEWFMTAIQTESRENAYMILRYQPKLCKEKMQGALHLVEFKWVDARGLPVSQWMTPEDKEQMEQQEAGYHFQLILQRA